MFSYAAQVLIREKVKLMDEAKKTPHIEERERLFMTINRLDLAVDYLLQPEDAA